MAGPPCDLHPDHGADFIIGVAATGEQMFLCQEGTAHFGLTLALETLDPAEIINAASALRAAPVNGETAEAPANKPARKRTPKAAKSKPPAESKQGLPETPPAADDR
jgi:hypothetical protein